MPQRFQIPYPPSLCARYIILRLNIYPRVRIVLEVLCSVVRSARETVRDELRRWGGVDVDLAEGDAWFEVREKCSESNTVSSVIGLVEQSTADDLHVAVIERREQQPHLLVWRVQRRRRLLVQAQFYRVPRRLLQQRPHLARRAHSDCIRNQAEQRPCALPISLGPYPQETNTPADSHIAKIEGRFQSPNALYAFQK